MTYVTHLKDAGTGMMDTPDVMRKSTKYLFFMKASIVEQKDFGCMLVVLSGLDRLGGEHRRRLERENGMCTAFIDWGGGGGGG